MGTIVFCGGYAVGIISLVDLCQKTKSVIPFVATSIPVFRNWILDNGGGIPGLSIGIWATIVMLVVIL